MEQDQMKIDPNVLEYIMVLIERYTSKQKDTLTRYNSSMKGLSHDWDDERTFGEMLKHIEVICKRSIEMLEQMRVVYKKFFYDEVLDIRKNLGSYKV